MKEIRWKSLSLCIEFELTSFEYLDNKLNLSEISIYILWIYLLNQNDGKLRKKFPFDDLAVYFLFFSRIEQLCREGCCFFDFFCSFFYCFVTLFSLLNERIIQQK